MADRQMLERWAARLAERCEILNFWAWLVEQSTADALLHDVRIEDALDAYHEIDQGQLDRERRALLDSIGVPSVVSDEEAEATADAVLGPRIANHVSLAYAEGSRVRLRRVVERNEAVQIPAGETGTVRVLAPAMVGRRLGIVVRLDRDFACLSTWGNQLAWYEEDADDVAADLEVLMQPSERDPKEGE
jgi:hypothetical protein